MSSLEFPVHLSFFLLGSRLHRQVRRMPQPEVQAHPQGTRPPGTRGSHLGEASGRLPHGGGSQDRVHTHRLAGQRTDAGAL